MSPLILEELPEQISCIDTHYQRQGLAACYLIESQGEAAFIDTGTAHNAPLLMQLMAAKGIEANQVKYVIPTHVHLDHAGGSGQLMQQLHEARLVVHPFGARHLIDPSKLIAGATAVYGEERFSEMFGTLVPVPAERVEQAPDGHRLLLGERELLCLDTPGHARHHFCIYDEQSRGFFTGDTFGLSYREFDNANGPFILPTTTPVQFDPDTWHTTLDRLMEFKPQNIYLTHFGRVGNPDRLADDLHQGLNDFVEIALAAEEPERSQQIRTGLLEWALQRLSAHGNSHRPEQVEAILGTDLDMNTQGLEIWLAQREKNS